ncbi:MAG: hypothetical protein D3906_03885 [Candidatus Electrothrix sp. AUS1_2]|nr:hypothetical protein [Candidatus Electrothrix sp. AUS1_2]
MSFLVKKGSSFIFGNAGISREMHESDYVRTLCTACIDKHTEEEVYVDLHLTLPQLKELTLACTAVLSEFVLWKEDSSFFRYEVDQ